MKTRQTKTRRGFTLVELLTVIAIIGILVTIISVAVAAAMSAAQRGRIAVQMSQIAMALDRYKAEFGEYPPDMFDDEALVRHVRKRWPGLDWERLPAEDSDAEKVRLAINLGYNGNATSPAAYPGLNTDFSGEQAVLGSLALWLGGFPNFDGQLSGFYADPRNPFTPSDTFDNKTFLDLKIGNNVRFENLGTATDPIYIPVVGTLVRDDFLPIVYFRGRAGGGPDAYTFMQEGKLEVKQLDFTDSLFSELGFCVPYAEEEVTPGTSGGAVRWKNPSTFQLIHPGLDRRFSDVEWLHGNNKTYRIIKTGEGIELPDLDNITNFSDNKELKSILP